MANLIGSLPSSFLVATLAHCNYSKKLFAKIYMCFFDIVFLPSVKIVFIIDAPDFRSVQNNREKKRIEKFISDIEG